MSMGWIGVDLDGTLAVYPSNDLIGPPVPAMVARIKEWLAKDWTVKIFTARAGDPDNEAIIEEWCMRHIGAKLPITSQKDYGMIQLWDDRAIQVIPNTGKRVDGEE